MFRELKESVRRLLKLWEFYKNTRHFRGEKFDEFLDAAKKALADYRKPRSFMEQIREQSGKD